MGELGGRRAVVTGAAAGIGAAVALELAARGATVLGVDRDPAVRAITEDGVTGLVADLADPAALTALAERVASAPGTDILVNCAAGYPPRGGFLAAGVPEWTRLLQVNVTAPAVLSAALARGLGGGRPGSIVNFGSVQERLPVPGFGPYVASKGAVRAATRALAVELAPLDIRVNAVAPGVVESPSTTDTLGGHGWDAADESPPTLLGRAGTPAEVARVVAFLVSDAASFVTGAVVPVDGGRVLSRRPDPLGRRTTGTS